MASEQVVSLKVWIQNIPSDSIKSIGRFILHCIIWLDFYVCSYFYVHGKFQELKLSCLSSFKLQVVYIGSWTS